MSQLALLAEFRPKAPPVVVRGDPDGLRPYQRDAVNAIRSTLADHRSTLLVMATGLGKTQTFGALARHWPGRVLVIAHRDELIQQAQKRLEQMTGEQADLEQAEWRAGAHNRLVVGSIQTLSRLKRLQRFAPEAFGLVIVDEAHHAAAATYRRVLAYFAGAKHLGVTATPKRGDERALGQVFESVAYTRGIWDGINDGYLVEPRIRPVFIESVKLDKVRTTAGDLNEGDLDAVMGTEENLHAVREPTMELAGDRPTVIFSGPTVATSQRLVEVFNRYRPGCAREINGNTETFLRRETYRAHARGEYQFLINVGIATEGVDLPYVSCVVLARITKSDALVEQMLGRGLRLPPGVDRLETAAERIAAILASAKPDCLVLDFKGVAGKHVLSSAIDILGGKYDAAVIKRAKKDLDKTPGMLASEALEKAKKSLDEEQRREAARRANVKAKVEWKAGYVDPFRLMGIQDIPDPRADGRLATAQQIEILTRNGFKPPAQGWSYDVASRLCNEIKVRLIKGFASPKMIKTLGWAHVNATHMSKQTAGALIGALARNKAEGFGWKFREGQKEAIMNTVQEPGYDG